MTWRKTGSEFDDECAEMDLSDHAYRTHVEAIGYVYKIEALSCEFSKSSVRRFATSKAAGEGIKELVANGYWTDLGDRYRVNHHAAVIHDSLLAQQGKRVRDREAQKRHRERKERAPKAPDVNADVSADPRQTDRQTDKHLGGRVQENCSHGTDVRFWKCKECNEQEATA